MSTFDLIIYCLSAVVFPLALYKVIRDNYVPKKGSKRYVKLLEKLLLDYDAKALFEELPDESWRLEDKEKMRKYAGAIITYAKSQTKAFLTLYKEKNYASAHHYMRLLSDCCMRTYVSVLKEGDDLDKYISKYLAGKEPNKSRYKGKELTAEYLAELIKKEYPFTVLAQKEGNKSTHLTNYYAQEMLFEGAKEGFSEDDKLALAWSVWALNTILQDILLHVVGHVQVLRDDSKNGKIDREVKMTKYGFMKSLWRMMEQ